MFIWYWKNNVVHCIQSSNKIWPKIYSFVKLIFLNEHVTLDWMMIQIKNQNLRILLCSLIPLIEVTLWLLVAIKIIFSYDGLKTTRALLVQIQVIKIQLHKQVYTLCSHACVSNCITSFVFMFMRSGSCDQKDWASNLLQSMSQMQ